MIKNIYIIFFIFISISFTGCKTVEVIPGEKVHKRYYSSGVLRSVWVTEFGKLNGIKREYNEDGALASATEYKNDIIDGMKNTYYSDGSLWIKEAYREGTSISKKEFDEEGFVIKRSE